MKILVTGALGFFGLNLVCVLAAQESIQVIASDVRQLTPLQKRFLQPISERIQHVHLDVLERQSIHALLDKWQVTHLVHAAALTPTPEQEASHPTRIVDVNLGGIINLLDAAIGSESVSRVLVVSSSGVYGAPRDKANGKQHETGPLQLDNLYSITKRSAELLTMRYRQLSGLSMAGVRLPALYGPLERQSISRPRVSAIGQLMAALQRGHEVRVAGPTIRSDWTYMVDAANAVWALLQAPKFDHDVYNVSCGVAVTWQAVVDAFVSYGLTATWVEDAATADIAMHPRQARLPMDISRLEKETGFVPQYPLLNGIATYIKQDIREDVQMH
ncbi:NAD(P)-dependent oxidoreductase [Chloroflexi bacterium TSY]|nr:NAD(P)-dependent oxidoreductase [Chloroflexi bacterium TSY]